MKNFWITRHWLFPKFLPAFVLLLGLGVAVTGTAWLNSDIKDKSSAEFKNKSTQTTHEIERRFSIPYHWLDGAKNLYSANPRFSFTEFQSALHVQDFIQAFPGVRGIGFVEAGRSTEAKNSVASRPYLLRHFEPALNITSILDTDFSTNRHRRTAIQTAVASGQASLSDLTDSEQASWGKQTAFLFVPIYNTKLPTKTSKERESALLGLLFTPIDVAELLANTNDINQGNLRFTITNLFSDRVLNQTENFTKFESESRPTIYKGGVAPKYTSSKKMSLLGAAIQLDIVSTPVFESASNHTLPIFFFLASSLISGLLAALLQLQLSWGKRTQKKMDAVLHDNQALLSTINMHAIVSVTDAGANIIDVNEAFCRISGYRRDELIGQQHKLIHSGVQSATFWTEMWQCISNGEPWRGEVCNRAKNGSLYWEDTFIAPFKNSDGVIEKYISIRTDISASKRVEGQLQSALRDSEALLRTLNMHAIVSIADAAGRIIDVNQAYCRISGYTRAEIVEENHRIVATDIQSPDFLSTMWRTISAGTPWRGEVCNRTKAGKLYWVDTFIAPFKDADGKIEKFISIRTDITTSKKAASRLASQRTALAHIIEGTNVGTWEWNVRTGEMRLNDRWANQIGYELNELKPSTIHTWDELTHPEDLSAAKEQMRRHLQHELPYYECETRLKHKEGHWIWVLTRGRIASLTANDQPEWISGTQMDITERKRAEAELQRSTKLLVTVRDQLTKAADVAELGIWTWNIATNELVFNERMFDIYEVPVALRKNKFFYDFWRSKVHPDDRQETEARLMAAVNGEQTYNPIFRIINKDQSIRYIQAAGGVERDEYGKATLVTGINRDITLQYRAEETLRKAKQAADDASQAKSAFLANMSHEIRTPMNAILGMLSLLRKTHLSQQQADYAAKTEGAASSLLNLLNDILDISKVEAGKMELDTHVFDLKRLLADVSDILFINVGSKAVQIVVDIDDKVPANLIGDALRLRQILTNLGSNAVKFTDHGQVNVAIKTVAQNVNAVSLRFSVKDTGIGISPENHHKIFTGFTQAEASTTRKFGGSGLGIAISQGLVKMMGGNLQLESTLGNGALFHFTIELPIAQAIVEEAGLVAQEYAKAPVGDHIFGGETPQSAGATFRLQNLCLLLVEDNLINQQVARELLASEGAQIVIANNGQEAIEIIRNQPEKFDLVLMDLQMPIMDGYAASKKIRQELKLDSLPIIAMTANAMASDKIDCIKAGLNDHIGKPFDLDNLVNTILFHTMRTDTTLDLKNRADTLAPNDFTLHATELGVDIIPALKRLGGKHDLYFRMLQMFLEDLVLYPDKLRTASSEASMATALRHLHTVKGVAGALGVKALASEIEVVEKALAVKKPLKTRVALITQICLTICSTEKNLRALSASFVSGVERVKSTQSIESIQLDLVEFRRKLIELTTQLENADMVATESILQIQKLFGDDLAHQYHEDLRLLEAAINALDFTNAQKICAKLSEGLDN